MADTADLSGDSVHEKSSDSSANSGSIFDDGETACPPSKARQKPAVRNDVLQVYQTGALTVVGFGGQDVPDEVCIASYREQLRKLLEDNTCSVLAFDCSGVKLMPSGMLGLLTTLRKQVDRIELYNPSEDIQQVLRLTNLLPMFEVKSITVAS
ncbi:STAS domain-containing protein [Planctopirus hydrillae]|uniref:STAS domain-containing protein n=1 Tax=Planctopirus hydrillae TaxID=1841610 RepID=A0A1C3E7V1_9PLAN|nr:STAS domain-containing protein [Planctopirus hydrillae]ODA29325.1 hypothetical protein A6X21_09405 [Planctopirus hydrillae]